MQESIEEKTLLKIYLDNTDKFNNQPLWKYILENIKESKLAGATVYKAVAGIGEHSTIHTFDILNLSNELPLIIEIIDNDAKISKFLKEHKEALANLFITQSTIGVVSFSKREE